MSLDLQQLVDTLGSLGEEDAVNVIASVLKARPELAPSIVNFCCPDLTYPSSKVLTERRSMGTVKSFNYEKGFGFIECKDLYDIFGNDVFLHNKQLNGFEPGTPVSFSVVLNKDNKPQAFDLSLPDMKGDKGKGKGFGKGMDMGKGFDWGGADMGGWKGGWGKGFDMGGMGMMGMKGKKGDGKGPSTPRGPDVQQELGTFVGTIKSFSAKSGYGFIECEDVKAMGYQDVFLHQAQKGEFDIGSVVQFDCFLNSKGQPNAKELNDGGGPQKMARLEGWE